MSTAMTALEYLVLTALGFLSFSPEVVDYATEGEAGGVADQLLGDIPWWLRLTLLLLIVATHLCAKWGIVAKFRAWIGVPPSKKE